MIRPVSFSFNAQTAVNNTFQTNSNAGDAQQKALDEFDQFVSLLRKNGVDVIVVDDTTEPHTPDSIFPNNWVSFHQDVQSLYDTGIVTGKPRIWISLLFAVLACGALNDPEFGIRLPTSLRQINDFLHAASQPFGLWSNDSSLDHVRVALLISLVLAEINEKAASWNWHNVTVRMAQSMGLHEDNRTPQHHDSETRKLVWRTVHSWDRYDQNDCLHSASPPPLFEYHEWFLMPVLTRNPIAP